MPVGASRAFWDLRGAPVVLGRVAERALRVLRAHSVVVVGLDGEQGRPVAQTGVSERLISHARWVADRVRRIERSISVARVPRAARPWIGQDAPAAYAAVPLKDSRGEVVGAVIAFDVDPREWDEDVLADLEETCGWIFAALDAADAEELDGASSEQPERIDQSGTRFRVGVRVA